MKKVCTSFVVLLLLQITLFRSVHPSEIDAGRTLVLDNLFLMTDVPKTGSFHTNYTEPVLQLQEDFATLDGATPRSSLNDVHFTVQMEELQKLLIETCRIDSPQRPVARFDEPLNATISMMAMSFRSISDKAQTFTVLAEVDVLWTHPCAVWSEDPVWSNLNYVEHVIGQKTWYPYLILYNAAADINYLVTNAPATRLVYYNYGSVWFPILSSVETFCRMNFKSFPFDEQNCDIIFESLYNSEDVSYSLPDPAITLDIENFVSPAEVWTIIGTSSTLQMMEYDYAPNESYARAIFTFSFRRRPGIYVANLIIPSFALVVLLLFSLLIPPNLPDRPIFCVTVVLAFAVLQSFVSSAMPQSADLPYLLILLTFNIILGFALTLYTLLTLALVELHLFQRILDVHWNDKMLFHISAIRALDGVFAGVVSLTTIIFDAVIFSLMFNVV